MYNFGLYNCKKNKYNPEQQFHPFMKVALIQCIMVNISVCMQCNNRCRKYSKIQYNRVIEQKTSMSGVLSLEQSYLIDQKILYNLIISLNRHINKPSSSNDNQNNDKQDCICLLYTSDAADDMQCVDLGGRRIIKKKQKQQE
eukprot:TRINITY_DN10909_c0_g1_i2.p3 TRINITY_DN10909_c0_g1~~TRINITY_DN10909_c0_g1_i2.p3  ORF type:complete len:142 (+),score=7.12 TRINITY_DN10909_c0_g1_i2:686-1111(+)